MKGYFFLKKEKKNIQQGIAQMVISSHYQHKSKKGLKPTINVWKGKIEVH